jgi:hypothetical protein
MKKIILISVLTLFFSVSLISCEADGDCGTKTVSGVSKSLNKGPEGGCYYINDNGNKSYVERTDCQC